MTAKKAAAPRAMREDPEVDAFMAALKHPMKTQIQEARRIILGVSPAIREGLKWKAPSFQTTVYFATVNLRALDRVELIFHKGAKKAAAPKDMTIPDPKGLVKWLAEDRCLVALGDAKAFAAHRTAFAALVRAWIKQL